MKTFTILIITVLAWCSTTVLGNTVYLTTGGGIFSHGSESVYGTFGLGVDLDDSRLSLESSLLWAPSPHGFDDVSHLSGVMADGLWHLSRYSKWDPYLITGLSYMYAGGGAIDTPFKGDDGLFGRIGLGVAWHVTETCSLRLDMVQSFELDTAPERFRTVTIGLMWRFGGWIAKERPVVDFERVGGSLIAIDFRPGLSLIAPGYYAVLDAYLDKLLIAADQGQCITFVGRAETTELGEMRAMRLVEYFIDLGVPVERLSARGLKGSNAVQVFITESFL